MLAKWTEILPLFVVRWLALQVCGIMFIDRNGACIVVAVARPGILVVADGEVK